MVTFQSRPSLYWQVLCNAAGTDKCVVQERWQRNNLVTCGPVFCLFMKPLETGKYS